ncbi:MAG: hypothetical protein RL757_197 [Bacteroidota bacterium]|jgi:hypothetical protein
MKKYWYIIVFVVLAAMPTPSCLNNKKPEQPMLEVKRESAPNAHLDKIEKENETLQLDLPIIDGHYELSWAALARTTFRNKFVDSVNAYAAMPTFPAALKAMEGQRVMIRGYVIPVEETQDYQVLVLSAFPYTQCFFCGQAGPESIMDIKLKNPSKSKRYARDAKTCFKGTLKLNDHNLNFFNFIMDGAEEVK